MSDGWAFLLFLVGWFALGMMAGVISSLCLIRWAISDPMDERKWMSEEIERVRSENAELSAKIVAIAAERDNIEDMLAGRKPIL